LDQGFTYGLLWLAGLVILLGAVALFIGYTAQQVGQAQEAKNAVDAQEPDALRTDVPAGPGWPAAGLSYGGAPRAAPERASSAESCS